MPKDPRRRRGRAGVSRASELPESLRCGSDSSFPHCRQAPRSSPRAPCSSPGPRPAQGLRSKGHRKGEGAREVTGRTQRGLGAACATSLCPGVRSRARGRKLSLFSHQLCRSRRQSRACPGRARFQLRHPGPGTATERPVRPGGGSHQGPGLTSTLLTRVALKGQGGTSCVPHWGHGCSQVTDGKTEAPEAN